MDDNESSILLSYRSNQKCLNFLKMLERKGKCNFIFFYFIKNSKLIERRFVASVDRLFGRGFVRGIFGENDRGKRGGGHA